MNMSRMVGRGVMGALASLGSLVQFAGQSVAHVVLPPFYGRQCVRQMVIIGYYSLPVVGLTAVFTGMVLALQSYTGFSRFSAEAAIPNIVVLAVTRELGPVLAGLMVSGRVGASIAAEIGTMRVTEQLTHSLPSPPIPVKYLIVPRVVAGVVVLPVLVLVADIIGVMGGFW